MENPNVACPENKLLAIEDWESKPVDDAAGVPDGGLGDGASLMRHFAQGDQEMSKRWLRNFLGRQHPVCANQEIGPEKKKNYIIYCTPVP